MKLFKPLSLTLALVLSVSLVMSEVRPANGPDHPVHVAAEQAALKQVDFSDITPVAAQAGWPTVDGDSLVIGNTRFPIIGVVAGVVVAVLAGIFALLGGSGSSSKSDPKPTTTKPTTTAPTTEPTTTAPTTEPTTTAPTTEPTTTAPTTEPTTTAPTTTVVPEPVVEDPIHPDEADIPTASIDDIVVNDRIDNADENLIESIFGTGISAANLFGDHLIPADQVGDHNLVEGMILAIEPSVNFPEGALLVIDSISVNHTAEMAMVTTRQGELSDVIVDTKGLVDLSGQVENVEIIPAEGVEVGNYLSGDEVIAARPDWMDGEGIADPEDQAAIARYMSGASYSKKLGGVPFKMDLAEKLPAIDAAEINGALEFYGEAYADVSLKKVNQLTLKSKSVAWFDADFEARRAFSASVEQKIADIRFDFAVPGTPISVTYTSDVVLKASLSASGSFRYEYKFNAGNTTGIQYKNDTVSPLEHSWNSTSASKNLRGDLNVEASVEAGAEVALNIGFIVPIRGKLGIKTVLRSRFDAQLRNESLSCSLKGDVKVSINYSLLLWSDSLGGDWLTIQEENDLCAGLSVDPEDVEFDPANVVPRGAFRTYLNQEHFNRGEDLNHQISQAEMETIQAINFDPRSGGEARLEGLQFALNLESLNVSNLKSIPDLSGLPRLRRMDINWSWDWEGFPQPAGVFPSLEVLDFYSIGSVESLPEELFLGGRLVRVDIMQADALKTLPDSLAHNPNLATLQLDSTGITSLPDAFGGLTKLEQLSLSGNDWLKTLPPSLGQANMLKSLSVWGNSFESLPPTVGDLYSLEELVIDSPRLTTIPDSINRLSNLKSLRIYGPSSFALPLELSGMRSLRVLGLENAALTQVPEGIQTLPALEILSLRSNSIRTLPEFLVPMTDREVNPLKYVFTAGNPLDSQDPVYVELQMVEVLSTDYQGSLANW
ncbi:leucine-rich repeat domain-containing protein [Corynebacterium faecale]